MTARDAPLGRVSFPAAGIVAIALLATVAVYRPVVGAHFFGEDLLNLHKAERSSVSELFARSTTDFLNPHYRPLWFLSLKTVEAIAGLDPRAFHLWSLAFHAGASLAVFAWVRRVGLGDLAAAGAASLFALHPASREAVAWISALNVVQGGFFFWVAIERGLAWAESGRVRAAACAAACFGLALGTQEFAYQAPLALLAAAGVAGLLEERVSRRRVFASSSAGLGVGLAHFVAFEAQLRGRLRSEAGDGGLAAIAESTARYLEQDLSITFGLGQADLLREHPVAAALGAVVLVTGAWLRLRERALYLFAWTLLAYAPSVLADASRRHAYLAIPPAAMLVLAAAQGFAAWRGVRPAATLATVLAVALGMSLSHRSWNRRWAAGEVDAGGDPALHGALVRLVASLPAGEPEPFLVGLAPSDRGFLVDAAGHDREARFPRLYFFESPSLLYGEERLRACVRSAELEGRRVVRFDGREFRPLASADRDLVPDRTGVPEAYLPEEVGDPRGAARAMALVTADRLGPGAEPRDSERAPADPRRFTWVEGISAAAYGDPPGRLVEIEAEGGCAGAGAAGGWRRRYRVEADRDCVVVCLNPYVPLVDPLARFLALDRDVRRPLLDRVRATVDGEPRTVHRAQAFFSAVEIGPGVHEVEFSWLAG